MLLQAIAVGLFYWIMKKNQKGIYWCLIGTFVVGILGVVLHLF